MNFLNKSTGKLSIIWRQSIVTSRASTGGTSEEVQAHIVGHDDDVDLSLPSAATRTTFDKTSTSDKATLNLVMLCMFPVSIELFACGMLLQIIQLLAQNKTSCNQLLNVL